MNCFYHANRQATAQCMRCGKLLCDQCKIVSTDGQSIICPDCYNAMFPSNQSMKPKKKSKKVIWISVAIIALLIIVIGSAGNSEEVPPIDDTITDDTNVSVSEPAVNTNAVYDISLDDLPNFDSVDFADISSRDYKRIRIKILLDDRKISDRDIINFGKHFYNILILGLDEEYDIVDGFQLWFYGKNDYIGGTPTVGKISYNIDGSKQFADAAVIKSWDNAPTEEEFKIVGDLMELLSTTSTPESEIKESIGNKYGITADEVYDLYVKCSSYYYPKPFDIN